MHPLEKAIPTLDMLMGLEPEEVALRLMFAMRDAPGWFGSNSSAGSFHLDNLRIGLHQMQFPLYGGRCKAQVVGVIAEALSFLMSQGLLVEVEPRIYAFSRRATAIQDQRDFTEFRYQQLLARDLLHISLAHTWIDFIKGDYDSAVFKATKAVEVALREAAESDAKSRTAVQLARKVFAEGGALEDVGEEASEKQAMGDLFAGFFGALKNPQSHRDVNLDDPTHAAAVIMFSGYLLETIDARQHRLIDDEDRDPRD